MALSRITSIADIADAALNAVYGTTDSTAASNAGFGPGNAGGTL